MMHSLSICEDSSTDQHCPEETALYKLTERGKLESSKPQTTIFTVYELVCNKYNCKNMKSHFSFKLSIFKKISIF